MMRGVQPSPRFIEVAAEIARLINLDAQMLIAGTPIEAGGTRFAFMHYGERDPDGLTLLVQLGVVPKVHEAAALRQLLNFNAMTPAAAAGFYAVVPGTDDVVCGWRFDIVATEDAARHIVSIVGEMCERGAQMRSSLGELLREMDADAHPEKEAV